MTTGWDCCEKSISLYWSLIRCALRDGHVSIRSGCRESNLPKPLLPSSHFNELYLLGFSPGNEV
jgi:hypothetical protein